MSFRLVRLGRRGLGEEDARDLCARVGTELVHLLDERAALFAELRPRAAVSETGIFAASRSAARLLAQKQVRCQETCT